MAAILIVGDTLRSPELRHEVPLSVPDPFLYAESGDHRAVVVSALEADRIAELGTLDVVRYEDVGYDELLKGGLGLHEVRRELVLNGCRHFGIASALTPETFPLAVADHLRTHGVEIAADQALFDARRRVKNEQELAGIRRACRAVEAGVSAGVEMLRAAGRNGGGLTLDGDPLTSERIKTAVERAFGEHGAAAEECIVSHGEQTAIGHDGGSGQILPGEPVVFDLFPRDRESACYSDFTRTFTAGDAPHEIREFHRLAKEALDLAVAAIRPGVIGFDVHKQVCDFFHEHGYPTQLHKGDGEVLRDGFFHATGHGVGLEVHEQPALGRTGTGDVLIAGDVVAVEPGLYRHGFGGVRLEDLILVTENGAEVLTKFPYELEL